MSDGKFLTKETKAFLSDVLSDEIKFKGFLRIIKRQVINIALNMVNKYGDKYIPDKFDPQINKIAVLCGQGEWTEAAAIVGKIADGEIDLPGDKNLKTKMLINGTMFLASLIENWIDKKRNK